MKATSYKHTSLKVILLIVVIYLIGMNFSSLNPLTIINNSNKEIEFTLCPQHCLFHDALSDQPVALSVNTDITYSLKPLSIIRIFIETDMFDVILAINENTGLGEDFYHGSSAYADLILNNSSKLIFNIDDASIDETRFDDTGVDDFQKVTLTRILF